MATMSSIRARFFGRRSVDRYLQVVPDWAAPRLSSPMRMVPTRTLPHTRASHTTNPSIVDGMRWRSYRSFHSSSSRRSSRGPTSGNSAEPSLSLAARFRKLSREYGWTALGVYTVLSILDFPFCFLLVRMVGTEKIASIEHVVLNRVQAVVPEQALEAWNKAASWVSGQYQRLRRRVETDKKSGTVSLGSAGTEERHENRASLATQLALAYAVHKSFIFVRIPLAAAILPKVVKVLRSFGWNIGKRRR